MQLIIEKIYFPRHHDHFNQLNRV